MESEDMTCLKFSCMDQVEYNLQCNCTIGRGQEEREDTLAPFPLSTL